MGIDSIKKFIDWCRKEGKNPSHIKSFDEYALCEDVKG